MEEGSAALGVGGEIGVGQANSSSGRLPAWFSHQLRRQLAASAATIGVLVTLAGALASLGVLLTALATVAGAFALEVLGRLGVAAIDFVSFADLPRLGLRFVPEFAFTVGFFSAMAIYSGFAAWIAALAVQSHREALARAQKGSVWQGIETWMVSIAHNGRSFLWLVLVTTALVLVAVAVVPRWVRAHDEAIRSGRDCTHYVTWNKDAWADEPPFASARCATQVAVLGDEFVFLVDGATYLIPKSKIAGIRIQPVHPR